MEQPQHVQCAYITEMKLDFCYTCYWVIIVSEDGTFHNQLLLCA